MLCMRCHSPMLRTHHEEVEDCGPYTLITQVYTNECLLCSALVKICLPVRPGEEITGMECL